MPLSLNISISSSLKGIVFGDKAGNKTAEMARKHFENNDDVKVFKLNYTYENRYELVVNA